MQHEPVSQEGRCRIGQFASPLAGPFFAFALPCARARTLAAGVAPIVVLRLDASTAGGCSGSLLRWRSVPMRFGSADDRGSVVARLLFVLVSTELSAVSAVAACRPGSVELGSANENRGSIGPLLRVNSLGSSQDIRRRNEGTSVGRRREVRRVVRSLLSWDEQFWRSTVFHIRRAGWSAHLAAPDLQSAQADASEAGRAGRADESVLATDAKRQARSYRRR